MTLLGIAEHTQAEEIVLFNTGKGNLSTLGVDTLPPEQASIDRPGAGPNHCERGTESSYQYADPWAVAT